MTFDDRQYILDLYNKQPRAASSMVRHYRPDLVEIIDGLEGSTFSEKIWKWVYNHPSGICQSCNKPTKFLDFRRGYTIFCSTKCMANSKAVIDKKTKTIEDRYGVSHFSKTDEYKTQFKQTCLDRYGVENPGQITSLITSRSRNKQLTFYNALVDDIKEFTTPNFSFSEYTVVRDKDLSWNCVNCGVDFMTNIFGKLPKCPTCYPAGNIGAQSSIEKDVLLEIRKFYSGEIIENSREIISPKELDLYFPEHHLAIEVNGIYWHSSRHVTDDYHQKKFTQCDALGIKLLMITDYEWATKKELIIRMIKHRLGLVTEKVAARKCIIRIISPKIAKEFLENNHIHGFSKASEHIGLFTGEELVSVLSYMTSNRFDAKSGDIEIVRLAFSHAVVGALGKYVKYIKSKFPDKPIVTYADLRYGTGDVYQNNNFELLHTTKPGYWYYINNRMYHRLSWTKQALVKMGYDSQKTGRQIMEEIGALRIYDCGHRTYRLRSEIGQLPHD